MSYETYSIRKLIGHLSFLRKNYCLFHFLKDKHLKHDTMADFRSNGHKDSEYLPETDALDGANPTSLGNIRPRRKKVKNLITECVFCKKNGEAETYYTSHTLKTAEGKILCPVLRAYTCPICGSSGDNAHTIKYCPKRPERLEMFLHFYYDKPNK